MFFLLRNRCKSKVKLFIIASSLLLVSCSNNNTTLSNNKHQINVQVIDSLYDISPILLFVVKDIIDSNDGRIFFRPEIGYDEYYYCLRFFKLKENLYITSWVCWSFPSSQYYNEKTFAYDTTCMYYFNAFDKNIIIMDYPESDGHGLFQKSEQRNLLAMTKKNEAKLLLEKHPPMMSDREVFRRSIIVKYNGGTPLLKPIKQPIYSPPYNSEMKSYYDPIIDVKDTELL